MKSRMEALDLGAGPFSLLLSVRILVSSLPDAPRGEQMPCPWHTAGGPGVSTRAVSPARLPGATLEQTRPQSDAAQLSFWVHSETLPWGLAPQVALAGLACLH